MMTRLTAASLVVLLGAGCGREAGPGESAEDREVAIYATVIRHMTSEPGQASGFSVVFVLDRVVGNAADPDGPPEEGSAIPEERQAALSRAVADTAPLEFVPDRGSVTGPMAEGAMVENGGIFLTLGPIRGDGERVEVEASSYLGNLAGTWQTWVVQRYQNGWRVIGTAGPVAVS
jgi:hypothetical protein